MDSRRSARFCRVIRRGLAATSGMNRASSSAGTTKPRPDQQRLGQQAVEADRDEHGHRCRQPWLAGVLLTVRLLRHGPVVAGGGPLAAAATPKDGPCPAVGALPTAAAGAQVVRDDVLAQPADVGGEDPPAGPPGDGVDEPGQPRVLAEHEDVERGAVPGQLVDLGDGGAQRLLAWSATGTPARRPSPMRAVGSPSVTTRTTGSASGCRRRCREASISACCRLVPCTHSGSASASCTGVSRRAARLNPITCSASCAEPGLDQVRQRQRGLLHRPPAALLHHRERQVDAQRDGRGGAPLGLDHLEVLDRRAAPRRDGQPPARLQRVGDRPRARPAAARRRTPRAGSARWARPPAPVRWSSWSPRPLASSWSKTRLSAVSPSRRTARGVSRSPSSPRAR